MWFVMLLTTGYVTEYLKSSTIMGSVVVLPVPCRWFPRFSTDRRGNLNSPIQIAVALSSSLERCQVYGQSPSKIR